MLSPSSTASTAHPATYVPRATDTLKLIFRDHFHAFSDAYDSLYARGIARIQCTNPECRLEYLRPFSCTGFCLCASCSQKRTLLFAEYLDEQLFLTLPHRQFVFSIPSGGSPSAPKARGGESPKALRIFFRHDQKLFAALSSLIFSLIRQFYRLAAGSPRLATAAITAFQPFGDFLRANANWQALVLEGGFAPDGRFLFLPIHDTQQLTEAFRRAVIKLFLSKGLLTEEFASTLLCWKKSGSLVDTTVRTIGDDHKTRVALAQYIARAPLAMAKLTYMPSQGTVRYTSDFNPAIGDTIKIRDARDFIAAASLFIRRAAAPPQGVRLIRYLACTHLEVAGSGPSGITLSVTPHGVGRRHTARRTKVLLCCRPTARCPNPPAAPPGPGR